MTKYGDRIDDDHWEQDHSEPDQPERTSVKDHTIDVIYVTDPDPDYPGYGREKYTAHLKYDEDLGGPYVLYVVEHRWKGNYWRDVTDWGFEDVPEPVRQRVASVLPVNRPEDLDTDVRTVDEGGESRWEKIHKPRMERMKQNDEGPFCAECGIDLTDPKNAGDPDEDGEWVCADPQCRGMHDTPMTVKRRTTRAVPQEGVE